MVPWHVRFHGGVRASRRLYGPALARGRLLVAGPDTRAYVPEGAAGHWAGVRFYPGTGPTFLGVPAHELRDLRVDLADLWPASEVRRRTARVAAAADPVTALEQVALDRAAVTDPPTRCCGRS